MKSDVRLSDLGTQLLHKLQFYTREAEPIVQITRAMNASEKRRKKQRSRRNEQRGN